MKRRVKVLRMRRNGPGYGRGWATWIYRDGQHCISGVFKPHPTHAAAMEHALQQVGLATPPEHREAP